MKKLQLLLVVMMLALAACGGSPTEVPATEEAPAADFPTPTQEVATAVPAPSGDAASGEALFNAQQAAVGFACATCHHVDSDDQLIGPGLLTIAERAGSRVEGQTADEYVYESITKPGVHVVENFPDSVMPRTYSEVFDEQQLLDLTAYVLSIGG